MVLSAIAYKRFPELHNHRSVQGQQPSDINLTLTGADVQPTSSDILPIAPPTNDATGSHRKTPIPDQNQPSTSSDIPPSHPDPPPPTTHSTNNAIPVPAFPLRLLSSSIFVIQEFSKDLKEFSKLPVFFSKSTTSKLHPHPEFSPR